MAELNNNQPRRVAEFYVDRSVFITGASGFMGKVLLEKLLYSCSGVKSVYILMRPKRERTIESRMEDMFKLPLFQRIQKEKPHVLKKVIPVAGDITMDGLGISDDMRKRLSEEVSVVFHGAATLKLESNLRDAVEMNTWGTWRVLELAKQMKNLAQHSTFLRVNR
ncbi:hypothetical protein RUM43_002775 [Polyplax serrata]|uniref:Fatty acyl-CoA reductase n=1 Tax=Polyplax serrata TaxID=468196 RepID=A0AAN8RW54_POLSC